MEGQMAKIAGVKVMTSPYLDDDIIIMLEATFKRMFGDKEFTEFVKVKDA